MELDNLKYNYVICGASGYYLVGYNDVINHPQVSYHASIDSGFSSRLSKWVVKINFSHKINKLVRTPFKSYVFSRLYSHKFSNDKSLVFVFFRNHENVYSTEYTVYLRNRYPNCKIVLYLQDIVNLKTNYQFEDIRNKFDLIISYDQNDALDYNLEYYPTPMSKVQIDTNHSIPESDVYFCGKAKDRYDEIVRIYNKCKEQGLVCDFNVMGIPNGATPVSGINYLSKGFSYRENLQHVEKTRCILEIMQKNAVGYTPRLWEAILYDKHIISNNESILKTKYYIHGSVHVNKQLDELDILSCLRNSTNYPRELKDSLSPLNLLKFIDSKFLV